MTACTSFYHFITHELTIWHHQCDPGSASASGRRRCTVRRWQQWSTASRLLVAGTSWIAHPCLYSHSCASVKAKHRLAIHTIVSVHWCIQVVQGIFVSYTWKSDNLWKAMHQEWTGCGANNWLNNRPTDFPVHLQGSHTEFPTKFQDFSRLQKQISRMILFSKKICLPAIAFEFFITLKIFVLKSSVPAAKGMSRIHPFKFQGFLWRPSLLGDVEIQQTGRSVEGDRPASQVHPHLPFICRTNQHRIRQGWSHHWMWNVLFNKRQNTATVFPPPKKKKKGPRLTRWLKYDRNVHHSGLFEGPLTVWQFQMSSTFYGSNPFCTVNGHCFQCDRNVRIARQNEGWSTSDQIPAENAIQQNAHKNISLGVSSDGSAGRGAKENIQHPGAAGRLYRFLFCLHVVLLKKTQMHLISSDHTRKKNLSPPHNQDGTLAEMAKRPRAAGDAI